MDPDLEKRTNYSSPFTLNKNETKEENMSNFESAEANCDLVKAWIFYKQFEDLNLSAEYSMAPEQPSSLRSSKQSNTHKGSIPVPDSEYEQYSNGIANTFLTEFEVRASAAVSAGCSYTDTLLAFKLLEKCHVASEAAILHFLSKIPVPDHFLNAYQAPNPQLLSSKLEPESHCQLKSVSLLSEVKMFVHSLSNKDLSINLKCDNSEIKKSDNRFDVDPLEEDVAEFEREEFPFVKLEVGDDENNSLALMVSAEMDRLAVSNIDLGDVIQSNHESVARSSKLKKEIISNSIEDHGTVNVNIDDNTLRRRRRIVKRKRKFAKYEDENEDDILVKTYRKHACKLCGFKTSKSQLLEEHKLTNHVSFKCEECEFIATKENKLRYHMRVQHGQTKFKCDKCDKVLSSWYIMVRHKKLKHGGLTDSDRHVCEKCGYVAYCKTVLSTHKRRVHENRGRVPCDQCDFLGRDRTDLKLHVMTKHEGVRFPCDQCDFRGISPKAVNTHKEVVHDMIRYRCNQCQYEAKTKQGLKVHIEKNHEGVRYACHQCDYQAKSRQRLKLHTQNKHEGIRYPCDKCELKFTHQANLKRHLESIHERRRFPCPHCGVTFSTPGQLNPHIKKKHGNVD